MLKLPDSLLLSAFLSTFSLISKGYNRECNDTASLNGLRGFMVFSLDYSGNKFRLMDGEALCR